MNKENDTIEKEIQAKKKKKNKRKKKTKFDNHNNRNQSKSNTIKNDYQNHLSFLRGGKILKDIFEPNRIGVKENEIDKNLSNRQTNHHHHHHSLNDQNHQLIDDVGDPIEITNDLNTNENNNDNNNFSNNNNNNNNNQMLKLSTNTLWSKTSTLPSSQSSARKLSKSDGEDRSMIDQGNSRHGWKNIYHKEEWGEANKYHDVWR
ncbi:hypothetical protein QR98_0040360 [Sarcoptes scabiei]|nr:hypothetical protein QR98_0040360 [Sarcoptes scabiei]